MQVHEIQEFIDDVKLITDTHNIAITYSNTSSYYGIFDQFNTTDELKKENKWRFIPKNNLKQFIHELQQTKVPNPEYGIIIDGNRISKLELVPNYM